MDKKDVSGPARSAVLIGAWSYKHLEPVPAAEHSLDRMVSVLCGPLCGWAGESVHVVRDPSVPGDLAHDLVARFSTATEVALFYFVGHGQPDTEDELCLALGDSSDAAEYRRTTSLRFDDVRHALKVSRAQTKIVILDCCFGGLAAARGRLGQANIADRIRGTGAYTIAASGEFGLAWFEVQSDAAGLPLTYFTKSLIEVVERGIAEEGEWLGLDVIFSAAADDLARAGRPTPTRSVTDFASRFHFARNVAFSSSQRAGRGITRSAPIEESSPQARRRQLDSPPLPTRNRMSAKAEALTGLVALGAGLGAGHEAAKAIFHPPATAHPDSALDQHHMADGGSHNAEGGSHGIDGVSHQASQSSAHTHDSSTHGDSSSGHVTGG